jgi:hypothetical protein
MSREERRAYQRQMKNVDRGPAVPAAAKGRAERNATRRAQRRARTGDASNQGAFTARFWARTSLIAVVAGLLGFSLQWSEGMPRALYVGLAVGLLALAIAVALRFLQRRAAAG